MTQQERDHVRHIANLARAARTYLKIATSKNETLSHDTIDIALEGIEHLARHALAASLGSSFDGRC